MAEHSLTFQEEWAALQPLEGSHVACAIHSRYRSTKSLRQLWEYLKEKENDKIEVSSQFSLYFNHSARHCLFGSKFMGLSDILWSNLIEQWGTTEIFPIRSLVSRQLILTIYPGLRISSCRWWESDSLPKTLEIGGSTCISFLASSPTNEICEPTAVSVSISSTSRSSLD